MMSEMQNYFIYQQQFNNKNKLTQFSDDVVKCITNWGKKTIDCHGDIKCLEDSTKQLRECLDIVFPNSKKIEFESDKINYILSTVFFLSNRLAKATIGLTELDKAIGDIEKIGKQSLDSKENTSHYEKMKKELDEILAKYF